jgi:hypothetical protein
MKVNVSIELSDEERDHLANLLDGKTSKRLATRKDVNELVHRLLQEYLDEDHAEQGRPPTRDDGDRDPAGNSRVAGSARAEEGTLAYYNPAPDIPRERKVTDTELWNVLGEALRRAQNEDEQSLRYWLRHELAIRAVKLRN